MTIKQLGGVFGRNPTFNDVTIEGQLTFDGDIDINSDLKVNGDLDVVGDITAGNQAFLKTVISDYSMEVGGQYGKMVGTKTGSGVGGLEFYSYSGGLYKTADLTNSGNLNLTTGNLIVSSGAGIDFSATGQAPGSTSELFDDYEEGTWTPAAWYQNGTDQAAVTNVTQTGTYTKVGNLVTVHCYLTWTISTTPVNDNIGVKNLPFTQTSQQACAAAIVGNAATNPATTWTVIGLGPSAPYVYLSDGTDVPNKADEVGGTGTKTIRFTLTYEAA